MGLRGLPEDRVRAVSAVLVDRSREPFRRRPGIPTHTADRHPSMPTTPLMASRAPSGHDRRNRRRPLGRTAPSWACIPFGASKSCGSGHRGLATPATFRPRRFSRPRRLTPRNSARVCFAPVTPVGFSSSGLSPPRWSVPLSRSAALLPLRSTGPSVRMGRKSLGFRASLPPERPFRSGPKNQPRPMPS
jgi:hypothetical protein